MRRIDAYLTNKAHGISPAFSAAVVWCDDSGPIEKWTLERIGAPPIGLGGSFGTARKAILELKGSLKNSSDV